MSLEKLPSHILFYSPFPLKATLDTFNITFLQPISSIKVIKKNETSYDDTIFARKFNNWSFDFFFIRLSYIDTSIQKENLSKGLVLYKQQ
jgi:hypothetical protein